jgi:hypothetical protein
MKNLILLSIALISTSLLFGQENNDTTRFKVGNYEFIIVGNDTIQAPGEEGGEKEKRKASGDLTYWSGFDIGVNYPMNADFQNSFTSQHLQIDPANSFVYSFNFLEQRIRIVKDYFGIVTGVGFTNSRYGFKDPYLRLQSTADSTFGMADSSLLRGFTQNQLRVNYFNIPVLLQINTSKYADKNFHITAGVIGGLRIGANVKYKYEVAGGKESKSKDKGTYNLNAFQFSGTVRVGYKDFGLFANYNLLSLYEDGKSEVAYPLSFGASFHF